MTQYRGLGADVRGLSIDDAVAKAGLNWKTVPMPVLIQGKTENRPAPEVRALVRSDNGGFLGTASSRYKPIHNRQLVGSMIEAASAGGLQLERLGSLDGGQRVWGVASFPNSSFTLEGAAAGIGNRPTIQHGYDRKFDDTTHLQCLMGSGHAPGIAFNGDLIAWRQICGNGAVMDFQLGRFHMTHAGTFDSHSLSQMASMFAHASVSFHEYEENATRLRSARITDFQLQLMMVQLFQPQLLVSAIHAGLLPSAVISPAASMTTFNGIDSAHLLEAAGAHSEVLDSNLFSRPVIRLLELQTTAPGSVPGTLWGAYNTATYWVDHERGRDADSGLNAALFGEGRNLKLGALRLARQYEYVLANRNTEALRRAHALDVESEEVR